MTASSDRWPALLAEAERELRRWRRAHPDATLTEIEAALDGRLQTLRAGLLGDLAVEAPAHPGRCPDCGEVLGGRGDRPRTLRTQGERALTLTRPDATCPACGAGLSPPRDERLGLLPGSTLTPWLVESVVRLGACLPFEQVPALLAHFTGVAVSAETARRLTEAAGAVQVARETAAAARLGRTAAAPPIGPPVQLLSVDGAMVPLVGGEWAEARTLAIGTVTAGTDGAAATDLSYCSRLTDAAAFADLAIVETHRRGTTTAGTVVAVAAGAAWCQRFVDLHRPDAVRVLDFPHAVAHLGTAAQAVFGTGSAAASEWLGLQAHALRHGAEAAVLAELARLAGAPAGPPEARTVCIQVLAYLTARREQIRYQRFVAAGYPIGSGCVERANKLVVEARLKGSGMHWARANVNPLLALRTLVANDRWAEAWPAIWTGLRAAARDRAAQRRRARAPVAARRPAPSAPSAPDTPRPPRAKSIVNGKPTAAHPWRRASPFPFRAKP